MNADNPSNPFEQLIKLIENSASGKYPVFLVLPSGKEIYTFLPKAEAMSLGKRIVDASPPCPCGCGSYELN